MYIFSLVSKKVLKSDKQLILDSYLEQSIVTMFHFSFNWSIILLPCLLKNRH